MTFKVKNILQLFRFLLLVLFVGYYSNITLFYHTHLVDGQLITHSHWFRGFNNDIPVESHTHIPQEYILIHSVDKTAFHNDLDIPYLIQAYPICLLIENTLYNYIPISEAHSNTQLRAPPSFC